MDRVRYFVLRHREIVKDYFVLAGPQVYLPEPRPPKKLEKKAGTIQWRTDYSLSREEASRKKLPLCLCFFDKDNPRCAKMNDTLFCDPRVVDPLNRHFISVKLDARDHLLGGLNVKELPTIILAGYDGKIFTYNEGDLDVASFLQHMEVVRNELKRYGALPE